MRDETRSARQCAQEAAKLRRGAFLFVLVLLVIVGGIPIVARWMVDRPPMPATWVPDMEF